MKKMINTSMIYFIAAMVAGVFYREFTKFQGFTGKTTLGVMHTHLLVLGMFFFLLAALFCGMERSLVQNKSFRRFYVLYNISLPFLSLMLLVRGILQVNGTELSSGINAMISGFAGISHILMMVSLILFFVSLRKVFAER